jgi:hypothetical protein
MKTVVSALNEFWSKQGIKLRPGLSTEALAKVESQLNVSFPNDLKDYFLFADGFDGETDNENISFLSIEEAARESTIWSPPVGGTASLFAFADFLIFSHVYMIELRNTASKSGSVYVVYDSKHDFVRKVASTFTDFVKGYVANDYSVLFPK